MELTDYHGMPVLFADSTEALTLDPAQFRGHADVIRVERPSSTRWDALRDRGFVIKPQYVSWLVDTEATEQDYMAALGRRERQSLRVARRQVADEGLGVDVCALDDELLEQFLILYREAIGAMHNGVLVACDEREQIRAERDSYDAVCARKGTELIGCCLVKKESETGIARLRFMAVNAPHRMASLSRVLYLRAMAAAREACLGTFSFGKDRNLYGHIAKPGLLNFKRGLGQVPHPSHLLDPSIGYDQADLVLGYGALIDPVMMLGYPSGQRPTNEFRLEVYGRDDVDLRPYRRRFPNLRLHRLESSDRADAGR